MTLQKENTVPTKIKWEIIKKSAAPFSIRVKIIHYSDMKN